MKRIINRTWHFLCAQDSSYTWSDGWPVYFTHWGPGEPSNVADEGCVAMHGARFFHGTWNDTKCDVAKAYICKMTTGTEENGPGQCPVSSVSAPSPPEMQRRRNLQGLQVTFCCRCQTLFFFLDV